jgi:trans-aconitate methyltransferase
MTSTLEPSKQPDGLIFVSYHQSDYEWAHWVAWQLNKKGFDVFFAGWHVAPGNDFTREMHHALQEARRVLAIVSPRYMTESSYGWMEISAFLAQDPLGIHRSVVPVKVADFQPNGLLRSRAHLDLFDKDERSARKALLASVMDPAVRPRGKPSFPGAGPGVHSDSISPPYPRGSTASDFIEAADYEGYSRTQARQRGHLLRLVELFPEDEVVDVGCGPGGVALQVASHVKRFVGMDKNPDMVELARSNTQAHGVPAKFVAANLLEYQCRRPFSVVLTNHTMHWIGREDVSYRCLYELLREGGRLGLHQGGNGTHSGLIEVAMEVVAQLGLSDYFIDWKYPHYYPTVTELRSVLRSSGFTQVETFSSTSEGDEYPTLIEDFAVAGLAPFVKKVPKRMQDPLRTRR